MKREEFEAGMAPALAFLGALYWDVERGIDATHPEERFVLTLDAPAALALSLSLRIAIQAIATLQELIKGKEEPT